MSRRGQVVIWFSFVIVALVVITVSAILAPAGVQFTTASYLAGEKILNNSLDDINDIQDVDVRTAVFDVVDSAKDATEDNIEVNSAIFRYGWVIVVALVGFILFLLTRSLTNFGPGSIS